jgi:hypothetical protein
MNKGIIKKIEVDKMNFDQQFVESKLPTNLSSEEIENLIKW